MSHIYKKRIGGKKMATTLKGSVAALDSASVKIGDVSNDEFLSQMKKNGRSLKKLLNISKNDIQQALREAREEWK